MEDGFVSADRNPLIEKKSPCFLQRDGTEGLAVGCRIPKDHRTRRDGRIQCIPWTEYGIPEGLSLIADSLCVGRLVA